MLNLLPKTIQKELCRKHARVGNDTENMQACNGQRERLWGMLLTTNQGDIMKKQKLSAIDSQAFNLQKTYGTTSAKSPSEHKHVLPQTIWGNISGFIVSSSSTLCMSRMFILVLPHKENKLHPIHRTIKSQDDFNMNLKLLLENIVVICLKNRAFAVSQTTDHPRRQERHVS